ncbi:MAG: hypothetical protein KGV58_00055 [Campylobacteraceae bacterium]|nr:hypothetical protein [Campylobacteraceae bacterium]
MNDISVLEEIGLQEVSRKTHIETKYLEYMVDKDFSKLKRTNALGFVKIIKREYNLELKDWLEEFEAYWIKNGYVDNSIRNQSNSVFAPDDEAPKRSYKGVIFLLIMALFGVAFYFFDGLGYIKSLQSKLLKADETNTTYTEASVVTQTKEQLDKIDENITSNKSSDNALSIKQNDAEKKNDKNNDENISFSQTADGSGEVLGSSVIVQAQDDVASSSNVQSTQLGSSVSQQEIYVAKAVFIPTQKLWLGVVELGTHKKTSHLTSDPVEIDLQIPQIVVTGHGLFTLEDGTGNTEVFKTQGKQYYYVDGGSISPITRSQFVSYNGGKAW